MDKQVLFLNMFPDYEPPEALLNVLSQAVIVAADIDAPAGKISLAILSPQYIPRQSLSKVARDLCGVYGLRNVEIRSTHPETELQKI